MTTTSPRRRTVLQAMAACALCALAPSARASGYPDRAIRLIVAFSPGGPTDVLARIIARKLAEQLHASIVVENRPGAGGNIATELVAGSAADGYTLLYNSSSISISPALFARPELDPGRIFTPVAYVATVPLVLIVNPKVQAATPAEFIALLKRQPGKLNFGSSGNGTIDHLTSVLFARQAGVQFTHVPYKGNAAALPDLLSGRIDFMMSGSINAFLPYVKNGQLRAIAATTARRVSVLPDCPTLAETVLPGFDSGTWQGIVGPAHLPGDVVARVNSAIETVLRSPDTTEALTAQGAQATGGSAQAYGELIASEYRRWTDIIKETGATSS
jgi:tripartite-type tricarboxylate transporter receptor subunit TctC